MPSAPAFDAAFRARLRELLIWRRDVRRFRPDPLPQGSVEKLLELVCLAPSVGLSQPWRFILVDDPLRRAAVRRNFETCNAEALARQEPERAAQYARLKPRMRVGLAPWSLAGPLGVLALGSLLSELVISAQRGDRAHGVDHTKRSDLPLHRGTIPLTIVPLHRGLRSSCLVSWVRRGTPKRREGRHHQRHSWGDHRFNGE